MADDESYQIDREELLYDNYCTGKYIILDWCLQCENENKKKRERKK